MQLRFSFLRATKHLVERQIATNSVVTLTFPLPKDAKNRIGRTFGTAVASYCGKSPISLKRKRICTQKRLGSFTGFNPITGNTSDLDAGETLLGSKSPTKLSSDSLSVKMLRFENQFRILSKQQATIELNSLLYFWYEKLPPHSYIPTTPPKSVKAMLEWVESMRPEFQPNLSTYQTLLDAFIKRNENLQIAEVILNHMLDVLLKNRREGKSSETSPTAQIDDTLEVTSVLYSYHKVMTIYSKRDNALATEHLLHQLEKTCHEENVPILSNETYSIAISSWAKHGKPREAEHVLYSMMNLKDKTLKHSATTIMPTKENFDACLNAWVAYPTKNSGQRAELLVLKMLELSENGYNTKPNYKSYSKIVHAWVNSKHDYALARVDKIMETLERMDWSGEADNLYAAQTVAQTYLAAMKACSYAVRSKWAVKKCVDYLSRLEKVLGLENVEYDTLQLMYSALIYTYAQSELPETEARVQEIFIELDIRHKKYVKEKLAAKVGEEDDYDPYISVAVYRALLHAFAKTGSGQKAETVLKRMMHEYLGIMDKSTDVNQLHKIDTNCFNSVLLAWSRSTEPDAGHQAEKLFRQMYQSQSSKHMSVRMDVVSYNAVLSAMSGSTDIDVARRGDTYFKQILESSDPKCRASTVTYTKAISLWTNIGTREALNRADELLNEMKASNDSFIKPTKQTFKAYLEVLKKCSSFLSPEDYQNRSRETNRMIKAH